MLPPPAIPFRRSKQLTAIEQLTYEIEEIEASLVVKKIQLRDLLLQNTDGYKLITMHN